MPRSVAINLYFAFDWQGNKIGNNEGDDDDDRDKYDLNEIISFPGFNVHPPSGTHDVSVTSSHNFRRSFDLSLNFSAKQSFQSFSHASVAQQRSYD